MNTSHRLSVYVWIYYFKFTLNTPYCYVLLIAHWLWYCYLLLIVQCSEYCYLLLIAQCSKWYHYPTAHCTLFMILLSTADNQAWEFSGLNLNSGFFVAKIYAVLFIFSPFLLNFAYFLRVFSPLSGLFIKVHSHACDNTMLIFILLDILIPQCWKWYHYLFLIVQCS